MTVTPFQKPDAIGLHPKICKILTNDSDRILRMGLNDTWTFNSSKAQRNTEAYMFKIKND